MGMDIPVTKLKDGVFMPVIGLGTGFGTKSAVTPTASDVETLVYHGISVGYRHLDCARAYMTEDAVGAALDRHVRNGHTKRKDIFITSKLFSSFHGHGQVEVCLNQSLRSLRTKYLDLYLIHNPCSLNAERKRDGEGRFYPASDTNFLVAWRQMEELYLDGFVNAIGVSNFNQGQLQRLLDECDVKPVVNQIESHPHFNNEELIRFCQRKNIHVTAYSPFGSDGCGPLGDPTMIDIASRRETTTAQLCLRFALQRGLSVVPRTKTLSRLPSNLLAAQSGDNKKIFFSEKDMEEILRLTIPNGRCVTLKPYELSKEYPFEEVNNSVQSIHT